MYTAAPKFARGHPPLPVAGEIIMSSESEQFMVTVPTDWNLEKYCTEKRKFPSVQDFIREVVRREIETYEKENKK